METYQEEARRVGITHQANGKCACRSIADETPDRRALPTLQAHWSTGALANRRTALALPTPGRHCSTGEPVNRRTGALAHHVRTLRPRRGGTIS